MAATPFSFAREFKTNEARFAPIETPEPTLTLTEHEAVVAAAVQSALAQGHEQGLAAARAEQAERLAQSTAALAEAMGRLMAALDEIADRSVAEAAHFAQSFAAKLAEGLVERLPAGAIESAARMIFADLRSAPHVVVRVAPDLVEPATVTVKAIARDRGHEGRIIVMGEPEIAPADVIIEWADGGLIVDRAATARVIADTVAHLAGGLAGADIASKGRQP